MDTFVIESKFSCYFCSPWTWPKESLEPALADSREARHSAVRKREATFLDRAEPGAIFLPILTTDPSTGRFRLFMVGCNGGFQDAYVRGKPEQYSTEPTQRESSIFDSSQSENRVDLIRCSLTMMSAESSRMGANGVSLASDYYLAT